MSIEVNLNPKKGFNDISITRSPIHFRILPQGALEDTETLFNRVEQGNERVNRKAYTLYILSDPQSPRRDEMMCYEDDYAAGYRKWVHVRQLDGQDIQTISKAE